MHVCIYVYTCVQIRVRVHVCMCVCRCVGAAITSAEFTMGNILPKIYVNKSFAFTRYFVIHNTNNCKYKDIFDGKIITQFNLPLIFCGHIK